MKTQIIGKDRLKDVNLNRRKAIHLRCLNCSGWHPQEVTDCISNNCSLHPYRLGKGNQDATKRQKAIREYCLRCMNKQKVEVTKCTSVNCSLFAYRKGSVNKSMPSFEKVDHRDGPLGRSINNSKIIYRFI